VPWCSGILLTSLPAFGKMIDKQQWSAQQPTASLTWLAGSGTPKQAVTRCIWMATGKIGWYVLGQ